MKYLLLLVVLTLYPYLGHTESNPNQCVNRDWEVVEYQHVTRGAVKIFVTPLGYRVTATNLACMLAIEVLSRVRDLPSKMTLGLVSSDYRNIFLAQWSMHENKFMLLEATIPAEKYETVGIFTIYPEPLARLKEIMIVQRMPRLSELPPHLQYKFKTNYIPTSIDRIRDLVENN